VEILGGAGQLALTLSARDLPGYNPPVRITEGGDVKRMVTVLLVGVLLSGGCSSGEDGTKARTYYESLDLSSPTAAA
jgi:hypothetical protein